MVLTLYPNLDQGLILFHRIHNPFHQYAEIMTEKLI